MKKFLMILLVLLLGIPAQAAVSVRLDHGAALLNGQGDVVVDFGAWEDIVMLGAGRFAAEQNGLYALMDENGRALTGAEYSDLRLQGERILACREKLWGILGFDGEALCEFGYTRLIPGDAGRFWALKTDPDDLDSDELLLLDASGREQSTGLFVRRTAETASCGLLAVQLPESGLWGFCDESGALAVPAEYESAGSFTAGLAPVVKNGRWGAVDADGKSILPAQYDSLEITAAGTILASSPEAGVQVFSPEGDIIAAHGGNGAFAAAVGDGYAVYEEDCVRIFDERGSERFTASANASVSEGLNGQVIIADGPWGEENSFIAGTEARYMHIYPLGISADGPLYACMSVRSARYMNELLNEVQLAVDMDSARWGAANAQGELLIPMEYESLQYLGEDRLLAKAEGGWHMLNPQGDILWSGALSPNEAASS